jgi:hypothetical protein
MAALKIAYKDPGQLKPRARNPRTHTAKQIKQIAASIKEFGLISPILIDGADGIIAGHGRIANALKIGNFIRPSRAVFVQFADEKIDFGSLEAGDRDIKI